MTPQEYISSGMIEMYALGSLSADEMREVENMIANHPEVKAEWLRVQNDLENFAMANAIAPDPQLRERILDKVLSKPAGSPGQTITKPSFNWKSYAMAASVVLLLTVGYIGYLETRVNGLKNDIAATEDSMRGIQGLISKLNTANADLHDEIKNRDEQLAMLSDTMTMDIPLNSIVAGHPMNSVVHWNKRSMQVAIEPMSLPATDSTNKYVLWAIADGVPVNEGSFEIQPEKEVVMMNKVMKAEAFAVSLETDVHVGKPAGPIYVLGKL